MMKFDQWEFIEDHQEESNLDQSGWVYYPKRCLYRPSASDKCKLAVILHGCNMRGIDMASKLTGWTSAAYQNDVILLFP